MVWCYHYKTVVNGKRALVVVIYLCSMTNGCKYIVSADNILITCQMTHTYFVGTLRCIFLRLAATQL